MQRYRLFGLISCLILTASLQAFNRSLFYRTSSFWGEPRFTKPWLTTLDLQLLGGSNHRSRNSKGKRTNLPALYGAENVTALSQASPGIPLELPGNPHKICFKAVADVFEADFNLYQNFTRGIFLQFHLPIVAVQICPSGFEEDEMCKKKPCKHYRPAWEHPLDLLDPFLDQFDLSLRRTDDGGLSDSTLFLGWSYTYEDTCYIDFIDSTIKTGVLFPTGRKARVNDVFSIPFGYNGHWGIPLSWDISLGIFDWATFGYHADTVFFFDKKQCIRMRTLNEADTGLIVLGLGQADVKHGTVWRMGTYFKADHFYNGLSLMLAFNYEQRNKNTVTPCDTERFNFVKVNKDRRFQKWARSIFHFLIEYDFAHADSTVGSRLGFFYDAEMTGLRTFNISTAGGYFGLDIAWCY